LKTRLGRSTTGERTRAAFGFINAQAVPAQTPAIREHDAALPLPLRAAAS